ncbi:hypothetical protein TOPH_01793 [Tolypocladium ophioglossoides CBS 100239]|uniref:Uncharacterized protein n=1 Tax=Tolypocladium ophioglossoides (strain CBS 100239) TaxID=1163406 RepID=A0A0L0NJP1_TOLOC|nr:hypothetical protein TOPH_01793 [Tolypocladium ophioglossoides CBS 100239]
MFQLPEAKRVRREDLKGSDGSDWSDNGEDIDADLQARLNARIARSLGLDAGGVEPLNWPAEESRPMTERLDAEPADNRDGAGETHSGDNEDEDLGKFEFRLFSSAAAAPKVVLENDKEAQGEGGLVAQRPTSYFLVTDIPAELKRQYEFAAVSGEDVLDRSCWRSWGLELPWKVTAKITTTRKAQPVYEGTETGRIEEAPDATKRKRPGKKRRIALRTKERAKRAQEETVAKKQMDKEEHMKDKKKRLNRLKKLRKRAKDKEKKMAAKGEGVEAAGSDADSDDAE